MKQRQKIKVAVAMSGGVDSSVAAFLLKKQGYQVFGLTMELVPCDKQKVDGPTLPRLRKPSCCGIEAIELARKVCQKLNIPHYVLNFRRQFKEKIIDNFCQEYLAGRTPNPCVRCNQYIKFDLLLKRAREIGADYLATGHYARKRESKTQDSKLKIYLLKGKDKNKDQSYFLYRLSQKQLKYILFPLGDLTKKEVRRIAKKAGLLTAERPESQEICFVPDNDYHTFIMRTYTKKIIKSGPILDKEDKILGQHQGIAFYTIGQRKGLRIGLSKPLYVIKINAKKNALIVGQEKDLYQKECLVKNVNWISGRAPKSSSQVMVKIRYKHQAAQSRIIYGYHSCERPIKERDLIYGDRVMVRFKKPQRAITPGQSAVFYVGEQVLGGGIICS